MTTTLSTFSESNSNKGKKNIDTLPSISKSVQKILDAFPQPSALLNTEEKVISVNSNFLRLFSYPNDDYLIGKRPEEIFNCIYAIDTYYESQMSAKCRKCGENLSVVDSKVICNRFTDRCNLTFVDENGHFDDFHNMKINKSPFTLDQAQYYLFSITDISNDVRRRLEERIFFHDVLNKAGNIMGILDVLNLVGSDDDRSDELYESLKNTSQDLINEIKYQRDLSAAENNELIPALYMTSSLGILNKTRNEIINSDVAHKKEIMIASSSVDEEILTDGVLLRRVLINMVKNALESTISGGKVVLGCEPLKDESFRFWVHNDAFIPMEIQTQLFYKSTSTKSSERGLGTFSMRLVGEKFLKGKVNFTSSEKDGTLFMIDLPRYSVES
jgi:PAS domain-containing protein